MLKSNRQCPICKSNAIPKLQAYHSGKQHKDSNLEIVIDDVATFECTNTECNHKWLPVDQERKIDREVDRLSRFDLKPDEVKVIRKSLPFTSKFEVANFLCLNEKAFTKWELGYSEPNRAYDLLLRLATHSQDNFKFIKHLHENNFKFDPQDYEFICHKNNLTWNFYTNYSPKFGTIIGSVSPFSSKGQTTVQGVVDSGWTQIKSFATSFSESASTVTETSDQGKAIAS